MTSTLDILALCQDLDRCESLDFDRQIDILRLLDQNANCYDPNITHVVNSLKKISGALLFSEEYLHLLSKLPQTTTDNVFIFPLLDHALAQSSTDGIPLIQAKSIERLLKTSEIAVDKLDYYLAQTLDILSQLKRTGQNTFHGIAECLVALLADNVCRNHETSHCLKSLLMKIQPVLPAIFTDSILKALEFVDDIPSSFLNEIIVVIETQERNPLTTVTLLCRLLNSKTYFLTTFHDGCVL